MTTLRGRWAQGITPRNFLWIIKDRLAAAERPGGFSRNHRKVRRQEELIWLRGQGFTRVVSILDSPHNMQAYSEAGLRAEQLPLGRREDWPERLGILYRSLAKWLADENEMVFIHHEEFGDKLLGVIAGYLIYAGYLHEGTHAVHFVEKLTGRNLDSEAREIVAAVLDAGLKAETD
jgi:hypothetical protein